MPLEDYRRKRDFAQTPEPPPDPATAAAGQTGRFVVQRHRATRLHYDFRLEIDGVLVSWAVPKGPTLDSKTRRMAVHVEDHPIEYFDFEGVIPAKQYGAGDVIVWDWGTWEPEAPTLDGRQGVRDGELKFRLHGQKLKGRFTIVRTSRRPGSAPRTAFEDDEGEQWLLIHKRDDHAVADWDAEDHPQSVKTGRTNDEVKANRDAMWVSEQPAAIAQIDLTGAAPAAMPQHVQPMLATLASKPFSDPDWLYEIKWDGFRLQAVVARGHVRMLDPQPQRRRGLLPAAAQPAALDRGATRPSSMGRSWRSTRRGDRTSACSRPSSATRRPATWSTRRSTCCTSTGDRCWTCRSRIASGCSDACSRSIRGCAYAAHVDGEGEVFFEAAKRLGVEGIVAKLRRSRYEPGQRTKAWLKLKIRPEQELVVGGWTTGSGNARDLGALAVGVYGDDEKLHFAGKVGAGFTGAIRTDLLTRLEPLAQDDPPFDPPPPRDYRGRWGGDLLDVTWVAPDLVIRAELAGWTRDGHVRQSAFKGIEPDRDPKSVHRETAVTTASAVRAAEAEVPSMSTRRPKAASTTTTPAPLAAFAAATEAELAALDAMGKEGPWQVGGHELKLTNLDKPLFDGRTADEPPITKRELIRYFARIAPTMLPHLHDRPLNLQRFPNGAGAQGFWQKNMPESSPRWLTTWHETGVDGRTDRSANDHLVADSVASLCWLGNQASFEIHAWTGKLPKPWQPTFAYIDIDPGTDTTWDETLTLARLYRTALGAPGRAGVPQDHRQARRPGLDPGRARALRLRRHERLGGSGLAGRRRHRPGPRLVGVGDQGAQGPGPAGLHAEREHQDARRAVLGAARRPARRSRPPSPGTSWTTRTCGRTAGPCAT